MKKRKKSEYKKKDLGSGRLLQLPTIIILLVYNIKIAYQY